MTSAVLEIFSDMNCFCNLLKLSIIYTVFYLLYDLLLWTENRLKLS